MKVPEGKYYIQWGDIKEEIKKDAIGIGEEGYFWLKYSTMQERHGLCGEQ